MAAPGLCHDCTGGVNGMIPPTAALWAYGCGSGKALACVRVS